MLVWKLSFFIKIPLILVVTVLHINANSVLLSRTYPANRKYLNAGDGLQNSGDHCKLFLKILNHCVRVFRIYISDEKGNMIVSVNSRGKDVKLVTRGGTNAIRYFRDSTS